MFSVETYIIFWAIIYVAFGFAFYILDRTKGVKWYRKWYNWTHKESMPDDVVRGFIFNREFKWKAVVAFVISTIQSILAISTEVDPLVELFMWFFEMPLLLFGFLLGPFIYRIWGKREQIFNKVDKWDRGDITIKDELAKGVKQVSDSVSNVGKDVAEKTINTIIHKKGIPVPPKEEEKKEEKLSFEDSLEKFKNRNIKNGS
jgi:hypothetical protein